MQSDAPEFDLSGALPFDGDARGGANPALKPSVDAGPMVLLDAAFRYIGRGLTLDQFVAYVATYDFGHVPPDYVVLHHTAIPSTTYARYPSGAVWDDHEQGLSEQQIYDKRKRQLDALMRYYRDTNGWDRGPHLFIDDRYIWLFTPLYDIGIHAAQGNSYLAGGKLHYSVGIEVIGYFEKAVWPAAVAHLVGGAVAALKQRLKTFDYIDGPWAGKVGAHRMYNKPSCPGAAITPSYYIPLLQRAFTDLFVPTTTPAAPSTPAERSFVVRSTVANIRNGKSQNTKYLGLLKQGDEWTGQVVRGQKLTIKGLTTDEWVKSARGYVWRGLLDEVTR